jgi:hypothetical protein
MTASFLRFGFAPSRKFLPEQGQAMVEQFVRACHCAGLYTLGVDAQDLNHPPQKMTLKQGVAHVVFRVALFTAGNGGGDATSFLRTGVRPGPETQTATPEKANKFAECPLP